MRRHIISVGLIGAAAILALTEACGTDGSDDCGSGATFCDPGNPGTSGEAGASNGFNSSGFGTSSGDNTNGGTSGDAGNLVDAPVPVCGNGIQDGTDTCDDGNTKAGDGCSDTCKLEDGFVCNVPGTPCAPIGGCGDGILQKGEDCDDKNTVDGDGCTKCKVDKGWICAIPATECVAAECGDGIVAGKEECDDKDKDSNDGCSKTCIIEPGYKCDEPGKDCTKTTCGDKKREGSEQCDDGNLTPFDGCSPDCTREPTCPKTGGECTGYCGDGIVFPGEECDDGNTRDGDGCSHSCTVEDGFKCSLTEGTLPDQIDTPIIYRDFSRGDKNQACSPNGCEGGHPDFDNDDEDDTYNPRLYGIAGYAFDHAGVTASTQGVLNQFGRPTYRCLGGAGPVACTVFSEASFNQWYQDLPGDAVTPRVNYTFAKTLPLKKISSDGTYQYDSIDSPSKSFFPIDNLGFGNQYKSGEAGGDHNFHFTSELRFWFQYDQIAIDNPPSFQFYGDDDVYVYINGKLAVDIGGVHPQYDGQVVLNPTNAGIFGLEKGKVYEFALFQAERNRSGSNYKATFKGFARAKSVCKSECGNDKPVKTPDEVCDDGPKNSTTTPPGYGECAKDCKSRGGYCGDGATQKPEEKCDDGPFNGGYGKCATDCQGPGPRCGDGHIDTAFGEVCDDAGANASADAGTVPYNTCASDCRSKPRCGDGIINGNEQCDGAQVNGVPCDPKTCTLLSTGPH